jgi:hypothetical protein
MPITIQYSSKRREIWNWYWRMWRQKFWKVHILYFVVAALSFYVASRSILASALFGLIVVVLMPLYPQLRFKPDVRTLTIDDEGVTTTIGRKSGSVAWRDIDRVSENESGYLVIQRKSGNAFIIPPRAFESEPERLRFFDKAKRCVATSYDR